MNQKKDDLLQGEQVGEKQETSGPATETAEETIAEKTTDEAGSDDDDNEDDAD